MFLSAFGTHQITSIKALSRIWAKEMSERFHRTADLIVKREVKRRLLGHVDSMERSNEPIFGIENGNGEDDDDDTDSMKVLKKLAGVHVLQHHSF